MDKIKRSTFNNRRSRFYRIKSNKTPISEEKYIICLDNFLTSSNNNIKKWINYPNFRLINKSVIEELEIDVNYIWHLACPPSPKFYYKDPISTSKIIFEGTFKLLKLAKANKASFLFKFK